MTIIGLTIPVKLYLMTSSSIYNGDIRLKKKVFVFVDINHIMHEISIFFFLLYISRMLDVEYHLFFHNLWLGYIIKKKKQVVAWSSLRD